LDFDLGAISCSQVGDHVFWSMSKESPLAILHLFSAAYLSRGERCGKDSSGYSKAGVAKDGRGM
jgi:hypothetical protein